jgi:hypothetical protein
MLYTLHSPPATTPPRHEPDLVVKLVCIDQSMHSILPCKLVCSAGVGVRVHARKPNQREEEPAGSDRGISR